MRKNKMRLIAISLIMLFFVSWISFYFYAEAYGYPWKHAELKKEAVEYMKKKYNMDVQAAGSSFNFKFVTYTAEVYNVNDADKNLIRVEKRRFYDEKTQSSRKRLEDNYSAVYWKNRIQDELRQKYPKFYQWDEIEKIRLDIPYFTTPLENGASSVQDENGVFIPLKPNDRYIWDVDLKTNDFSEAFLNELLFVIKDMANTPLQVDLVVTGKDKASVTENHTERTKMLNLQYENFKDIHSVEDLKKEISDF